MRLSGTFPHLHAPYGGYYGFFIYFLLMPIRTQDWGKEIFTQHETYISKKRTSEKCQHLHESGTRKNNDADSGMYSY